MKNEIVKIFLGVIIVLVLFWAVFQIKDYKESQRKLPYYVANLETGVVSKVDSGGFGIGDFAFTNQLNQPFTEKDVKDKVFVVDYFFVTCPGICKKMTSQLERVYKEYELDPNFKILSHTSKPDEDSASVLMQYAQMHGVKDHQKWIFLTGNKKKLYDLARNQYYIVNDKGDGGEDDFIHTERMVLVDQNKLIRGYYDGTDSIEVNNMIKDIACLLRNQP